MNPSSQNPGVLWHFTAAFVLAAILYAGVFFTDHHLRTRRGPWQVTFLAQPDSPTRLTIQQPALGLSNIHIVLHETFDRTIQDTVLFHAPEQPVPIGQVKYEDLTYLPGVVTLELFGHEIELLPRVLYVNRQAQPWRSDTTIHLHAEDRLPSLENPLSKKRRN